MRALPVALLLVGAALAGCAAPASTNDDPAPAPRVPPGGAPSDGGGRAFDGWTSDADAPIRPGVQVVSESGQCTSNFLFTSADNASVYLGLAAHCVDGLELGAPLDVANGAATGTLAYSSWLTMDEVGEESALVRDANDFALVLIPDEARQLVHPSVRHFGGPTALAASETTRFGEKVLTYGNSGLRQEIEPLSWHEGYVLSSDEWTTQIYTATPGVPGDSGSAVLTGDGRALGILVTLTILPTAGSNGVTHLDRALDYAREHAGLDVALATWDLVDGGLLPGR